MLKHVARTSVTILLTLLATSCAATKSPPADAHTAIPLPSVRYARPQDLELNILSVEQSPTSFPIVHAFVRNLTDDQILLSYGPGSLVVHCGPYLQSGPAYTSSPAAKSSTPSATSNSPPPSQGWRQDPAADNLLIPTHLPPGKYDLWVSLKIPDPSPALLESPHQSFESKP